MTEFGRERLFRVPDFVRLWTSNLLGDVGAAFATLALSVTAVLVLHASTFQVAVITALGNGAYLVLGIPIGVWADRIPPKRPFPPHPWIFLLLAGSACTSGLAGLLTASIGRTRLPKARYWTIVIFAIIPFAILGTGAVVAVVQLMMHASG